MSRERSAKEVRRQEAKASAARAMRASISASPS
jgi:hypothetical protein